MTAPPPDPPVELYPCPHCGVPGHWPDYEREQLALRRCPMSGLFLFRREAVGWAPVFMCGVCDCFGYRPAELGL